MIGYSVDHIPGFDIKNPPLHQFIFAAVNTPLKVEFTIKVVKVTQLDFQRKMEYN